MNAYNFIMILVVLCCVLYTFFMHFGENGVEEDSKTDHTKKRKFFPNAQGAMIAYLFMFFAFPYLYTERKELYSVSFTFIITKICFMMVIYTLILTLLLPIIKKYINSRAIGTLWFLPEITFLFIMRRWYINEIPLMMIPISYAYLKIIGYIWMIGFVFCFGKDIYNHFKFKNYILKNAKLVEDDRIINYMLFEKSNALLKKKIKVYCSSVISTPLAFSNKIILPAQEYTNKELELIFRHEIVHICRGDYYVKVYISFIQAVCFFLPFMKKLYRNCLNDIELSCDESVLLNEDPQTKYLYASIILTNVGNEAGFTTCLSANGEALKYRLSHIMQESKKHSGALFATICMLLSISLCNIFSFIYNPRSLKDEIPDSNEVYVIDQKTENEINLNNDDQLFEYLNHIEIYEADLTRYGLFLTNEDSLIISLDHHDTIIELYENFIMINHVKEKDDQVYYTKDKIDLNYIRTI